MKSTSARRRVHRAGVVVAAVVAADRHLFDLLLGLRRTAEVTL
jgi:hypothetical protein